MDELGGNGTQGSPPSSAPSTGGEPVEYPEIPAATPKFVLLCVNTKMGLVKLANVNITGVTDAGQMFQRMRLEYSKLRGVRERNPLVKPVTMQYIKVYDLHLMSEFYFTTNDTKSILTSK